MIMNELPRFFEIRGFKRAFYLLRLSVTAEKDESYILVI